MTDNPKVPIKRFTFDDEGLSPEEATRRWRETPDGKWVSYADHEAALEALQWTPITPENLPTMGDEMVSVDGEGRVWLRRYESFMADDPAVMFDYFTKQKGWTHFRPLTPPRIEEKPNG